MTRSEALAYLNSPADLTWEGVDGIFRAFGFVSASPDFETELYFHPAWKRCGAFPARDDGLHLVTLLQRERIRGILNCVVFHETYQEPGAGGPGSPKGS